MTQASQITNKILRRAEQVRLVHLTCSALNILLATLKKIYVLRTKYFCFFKFIFIEPVGFRFQSLDRLPSSVPPCVCMKCFIKFFEFFY